MKYIRLTHHKIFFSLLFTGLLIFLYPNISYAANPKGSVIGSSLCNVAAAFSDNLGKGLGCLAVITLGLSALYGKITWVTAVLVGVGIAVFFGADALVLAMSNASLGGNGYNCKFASWS